MRFFSKVKAYYKNIQVLDLSNSLINFFNYLIDRLNVGKRHLPVCWQNSQLKQYFKLRAWGGATVNLRIIFTRCGKLHFVINFKSMSLGASLLGM
jgi:hypothetical protein